MTYFGDDLSGVSLGIYDNKATITALDKNNAGFSKLSINAETIDLSSNSGTNLYGNLNVDTINENTATTGVTVEQVLLKDNNVTANTITAQNYAVGSVNFVSASRQANFRDLEVKSSSNNATVLITGDSGDISSNGLLTCVSMKTGNTTIQGTLDVSQNATFDNDVIINGELIFNNTATKINSTNIDVSDNLIVLNSGYSGNNINDSGIIVDRGDLDNAFIGWDESEDKFVLGTTSANKSNRKYYF